MNPDQFTLAELLEMAEARERAEWDRTTNLMAMLANQWRDTKTHAEPFQPFEFNPLLSSREMKAIRKAMREEKRQNRQMAPITILKDLFVKGE